MAVLGRKWPVWVPQTTKFRLQTLRASLGIFFYFGNLEPFWTWPFWLKTTILVAPNYEIWAPNLNGSLGRPLGSGAKKFGGLGPPSGSFLAKNGHSRPAQNAQNKGNILREALRLWSRNFVVWGSKMVIYDSKRAFGDFSQFGTFSAILGGSSRAVFGPKWPFWLPQTMKFRLQSLRAFPGIFTNVGHFWAILIGPRIAVFLEAPSKTFRLWSSVRIPKSRPKWTKMSKIGGKSLGRLLGFGSKPYEHP